MAAQKFCCLLVVCGVFVVLWWVLDWLLSLGPARIVWMLLIECDDLGLIVVWVRFGFLVCVGLVWLILFAMD